MPIKTGRPRLDTRDGFIEAFARILPYLRDEVISLGKAAKAMGISRRSLRRYMDRANAASLRRR